MESFAGLFWLGMFFGMLALGFCAGHLMRRWLRYAVLILLAFAPALAILIHGLAIGCGPGGPGGQACFGTGFGLGLFGMAAPAFLLILLIGSWISPRARGNRPETKGE